MPVRLSVILTYCIEGSLVPNTESPTRRRNLFFHPLRFSGWRPADCTDWKAGASFLPTYVCRRPQRDVTQGGDWKRDLCIGKWGLGKGYLWENKWVLGTVSGTVEEEMGDVIVVWHSLFRHSLIQRHLSLVIGVSPDWLWSSLGGDWWQSLSLWGRLF